MKLFIVGDPSGATTLRSIKKGVSPENIWVWEDEPAHTYAIQQQHGRINVVEDVDYLIKQKCVSQCQSATHHMELVQI